jgi:hypothetical protein
LSKINASKARHLLHFDANVILGMHRIETSYLEFKQTFHADVLRSRTCGDASWPAAIAWQGKAHATSSTHDQNPLQYSNMGTSRAINQVRRAGILVRGLIG